MLDSKDLEILQTMMTQIVAASEARMSAKIDNSIAASESKIMAYIESDIQDPVCRRCRTEESPVAAALSPGGCFHITSRIFSSCLLWASPVSMV